MKMGRSWMKTEAERPCRQAKRQKIFRMKNRLLTRPKWPSKTHHHHHHHRHSEGTSEAVQVVMCPSFYSLGTRPFFSLIFARFITCAQIKSSALLPSISVEARRRLFMRSHEQHASFQSDISAKTASRSVVMDNEFGH